MIDRYALSMNSSQLAEKLKAEMPQAFDACYNCMPSQLLPVINHQNPGKIAMYRWGILSDFANNKKISPKLLNVSSQQVAEKPSERKALIENRCIAFATGFFLWKPFSRKKVIPYYAFANQGELFSMAAIWEPANEFSENPEPTFRLVLSNSNAQLSGYQEDMPLILDKKSAELWLNSKTTFLELNQLLAAPPEFPTLGIHAVSPEIISASISHPRFIKPAPPADQHGNYTLFG